MLSSLRSSPQWITSATSVTCGALTAGGSAQWGVYKAIGGPGRLWVKLGEKRGSELAVKLRVTQAATAVLAPPCACDCRVTSTYHIKEFIFSFYMFQRNDKIWMR